jgi:hypothetical protein
LEESGSNLMQMKKMNRRVLNDLTTVMNRLDEKVVSFKTRKLLDKKKAVTGHYGIHSKLS